MAVKHRMKPLGCWNMDILRGKRWLPQLGLLMTACLLGSAASAAWHERQASVMGTRIHVELWWPDDSVAQQALDAVIAEMQRIDRAYSPYRADSELSVMNQNAAKGWVSVSNELFDLLRRSASMSRLTDGAFDITYASAGRYYNYREGTVPDAQTLDTAVKNINYRNVQLNEQTRQVRYALDEVYVDLGGIAKGYAVDRGIALLEGYGIRQASVAAGGDSRILGDRRGKPWTVGIRHPRERDTVAVLLPLEDTAVSTSGDYERFFVADGVRYHHILNPATGSSAQDARSVTILGAEATFTDALSTSVFVMGAQRGIELINTIEGVDAIVIDADGNMSYSNGLAGLN